MKEEKKDVKEEEIKSEKADVPKKEEKVDELELLKKENEELKKKFIEMQHSFETADKEKDEWKNKYYGVYADMANLRKQVQKECQDAKRYASQSIIEEFIPTFDSFDMALKNEPTDPVLKNYVQGFKMIHSKLLNTLKQLDVVIIDPEIGSEYNPNQMQAYSTVDGEEDNKIAEVFIKGYTLHDHLLRPAGVIVTHKAEVVEKKEENKEDSKKESENK